MHAGSAVLRRVTQDLLQTFEAQVPAQPAERPGRRISSWDPDMPASPGWQGKAASAVVVLAEVMFGASVSWQGTQQQQQQQQQKKSDTSGQHSQLNTSLTATTASNSTSTAAHASTDGKELAHNLPSSDLADAAIRTDCSVLEPFVVQALDDFSNAGVWSLPTHLDPDAAVPGNVPLTLQVCRVTSFPTCITPCRWSRLGPVCTQCLMGLQVMQALGENAILIRAMLEAVGVFARVLGRRFASSGVILRKVLLVLLERLADPCPSVATSAGAALGAVCLHCGYPSRQALLAANADYLVDGLCRQLRSLDSHPRLAPSPSCRAAVNLPASQPTNSHGLHMLGNAMLQQLRWKILSLTSSQPLHAQSAL